MLLYEKRDSKLRLPEKINSVVPGAERYGVGAIGSRCADVGPLVPPLVHVTGPEMTLRAPAQP